MANNKNKKKTAKKDKPKVEQKKASAKSDSKKESKVKAKSNKEESKDKKSMTEKTKVETSSKSGSDASRKLKTAGALAALLVLISAFVLLAVFLFFRIKPRVNEDLPVPSLGELSEYTNEEKITVEGKVKDTDKVLLFVNDVVEGGKLDVEDKKFSYEYEFEEEGEYSFEAASFKGGFFNVRGKNSESQTVVYDNTPPSTDVDFDTADETNKEKITIKGKTEENITVVLKKGDASYSTTSDDKGNFEIQDVELLEGENKFTVILEDKAGNQVQLDDQFMVTYSPGADLNGPGASTDGSEDGDGGQDGDQATGDVDSEELPKSAGELTDALNAVRNQGLMFVFGVIALLAFMASSGVFAFKAMRE